MENQEIQLPNNQQKNFFFERIQQRLKSADLNTQLKEINIDKLSVEDFILLGSLAYTFGSDYTGQKGQSKLVITNVVKRFIDLDISSEAIARFMLIMEKLKIEELVTPKEAMKELITKKITGLNAADIHEIRIKINQILKNSVFPVQFAQDIDLLIKEKNYDYQQLLKFNSFVYQQTDISGKILRVLMDLSANPKYSQNLLLASEYFDDQKFAIVYFDSIITLKEYQESHNNFNIAKFIDNPELIESTIIDETIDNVDELIAKSANESYETVKEEITDPNVYVCVAADQKNTDMFIKGILEEGIKSYIKTTENLRTGIYDMITNIDLVQHVYAYMKKEKDNNRTPIGEVYPEIAPAEIEAMLKVEIEINAEKYKTLVVAYTSEIPADNIRRVVDYVNNTIESLVVGDGERKSHLMQQLAENQITTYKHLHQTIALIEECKILGNETESYVTLINYLRTNENIFIDIFDKVQELESLQLKISMFTEFKQFYFPVDKTTV